MNVLFNFKNYRKRNAKEAWHNCDQQLVLSAMNGTLHAIYVRFWVYIIRESKIRTMNCLCYNCAGEWAPLSGDYYEVFFLPTQLQSTVYSAVVMPATGAYQSRHSYAQSSWVPLPRPTAMKNKSRFHRVKIKLCKSWAINAKTQNRYNLLSAWKSMGALKTIDP